MLDPFDLRTIVPFPHVVIVDSREQLPYSFDGIDAAPGHVYQVRVERCALRAGDYSVKGWHERSIAVERKSLADLFGTVGQRDRRERFHRELAKLAEMPHAAVMIEGTREIIERGVAVSDLPGRRCLEIIAALKHKYPSIRWLAAPSRAIAEAATLGWLRQAATKCEEAIAL